MSKKAELRIIAAVAANGVIGNQGKLPWHSPQDLRHFARTTTGGHLVMGRKTYESIGKPLPGRTIYVVSRNKSFQAAAKPVVCSELDRAIDIAANAADEIVWIAGGAEIFAQAMPDVSRMLITHFDDAFEGDVLFPSFNADDWETSPVHRCDDSPAFEIVEYRRRSLEH